MSIKDYNFALANGARSDIQGPIRSIRMISSSGPIKVDVDNSVSALAVGRAIIFDSQVDALSIINDSGSAVSGVLSLGKSARIEDSSLSGTVSVAQGTLVANANEATVGVAESLALAAATGRKSLRFRAPTTNTGNIYLGATGVTVANGCIELAPGDTHIETEGADAAWYAISDTAAQKLRIQSIS